MASARVLVVDDEKNVRLTIKGVLEDEGYEVALAASSDECMSHLQKRPYDVVLLDVWMPNRDGLEVLPEIRARHPNQYVVMISGHGSIETAVQATKLGAFDFVEKPLSAEKLTLVLEHALKQRKLEEENRKLRHQLQQDTVMIGSSVPMQALRQQIEYAAPTEGRILIYGENGTGKELVARLLHEASHRKSGPFEDVNCAAIPEDLIEAELFGNVKGAFTGATEDRKGKFELAHGGTLFLDEVGDMSLKTQAKVLRVLESLRFRPVGGEYPIEVDVRVIAATNKNLEREIENGSFRQDLFFRLNVLPFEVPPLRHRREDIPDLIDYFLDLFCRRYGRPSKELTSAALDKLSAYDWPGNVRELKNMVERIAIMVQTTTVDVGDLPESLDPSDRGHWSEPDLNWHDARVEFEREFLWRKLIENDRNISKTAAAIGMERTHLHRKLKALEIKIK